MPHICDDAGKVHLGNTCFDAKEGGDERHLEDGADVEAHEGDLDEEPFFGFGHVARQGQRRGEGGRWPGGECEDVGGVASVGEGPDAGGVGVWDLHRDVVCGVECIEWCCCSVYASKCGI